MRKRELAFALGGLGVRRLVFEQVAGLAIKRGAELRQGFRVDTFRDGYSHDVVDRLARQARLAREAVASHPCPFGHLFELPADRHGRKYSIYGNA